MSSLNTFGAILTYAIALESRLRDYYTAAGNPERAAAAESRCTKLERVRRQNVVEITLEPIEGLDEANYALNLEDTSPEGQRAAAQIAARFYQDCAPKINAKEAQRALERCGRDHQEQV
ncbi:MAG: hypothetical protein IAE83_14040 [Anaerolinea sp.]|nr:hypothetical protein [Anaerolinea sp.]